MVSMQQKTAKIVENIDFFDSVRGTRFMIKGLICTYNFSTLKIYDLACVPSTAVNFIAGLTNHWAYKRKKLAE